MKHVVKLSNTLLTRQRLANPFLDVPMKERLHSAKSIDLRGNYIEEMLPNGYSRIVPINPSKTF
jgi:hypothetical protein